MWSAASWAVAVPSWPLEPRTLGRGPGSCGWMSWAAVARRPRCGHARRRAGVSTTAATRKTRVPCAQVGAGASSRHPGGCRLAKAGPCWLLLESFRTPRSDHHASPALDLSMAPRLVALGLPPSAWSFGVQLCAPTSRTASPGAASATNTVLRSCASCSVALGHLFCLVWASCPLDPDLLLVGSGGPAPAGLLLVHNHVRQALPCSPVAFPLWLGLW